MNKLDLQTIEHKLYEITQLLKELVKEIKEVKDGLIKEEMK